MSLLSVSLGSVPRTQKLKNPAENPGLSEVPFCETGLRHQAYVSLRISPTAGNSAFPNSAAGFIPPHFVLILSSCNVA